MKLINMRTYCRRPPRYQILENAPELCRLCLEKSNENVPIYESDSNFSSLALRIMVCVGLEMSKEDCFPNHICITCHNELNRCYAFRKKCENSYQKLKSHMVALKLDKLQKENELRKNTCDTQHSSLPENETLVFMLNEDGSVDLQENTNRFIIDDGTAINIQEQLEEVSNSGIQIGNYEQSNEQNGENPIAIENIEPPFISNIDQADPPTIEPENSEELVVLDTLTADSFVISLLSTLGIVTIHEDNIVVLSPSTSRNIELETGDGKHILLELTEEVDEMDSTPVTTLSHQEETFAMKNELTENTSINLPSIEWDSSKIIDIDAVRTNSADLLANHSTQNSQNGTQQKTMKLNSNRNVKINNPKIVYRDKRGRVTCDVCSKSFATRTVLARHQAAVHARHKPFECPHCGKHFAQKEVWARHLLVHQEKRPFQCQSCPKSFTQRHSLLAHEQLHKSPAARPMTLHQCSQCPKVFLYSSGLSRHMAQHLGRVWPCAGCGRKFSDSSALNRHARSPSRCAPKKHKNQTKISPAPATGDTG